MKRGRKITTQKAAIDPQQVLGDLVKHVDLNFIAMDQDGSWWAWKRQPAMMVQSKGWFAPGSHIKIKSGILSPAKDWKTSLLSLSQPTEEENYDG